MQGSLRFDAPTDGVISDGDRRQILDHEALKTFFFAGNATITVVSLRTKERYTYRIKAVPLPEEGAKPSPVGWFVAVLTGPDNSNDFTYLGHIFRESKDYVHGRKSVIGLDAPSRIAWEWFYATVVTGDRMRPDKCEVWHEGRCGACNRKLTVPESIEAGIGPDCAKRLGIPYKGDIP